MLAQSLNKQGVGRSVDGRGFAIDLHLNQHERFLHLSLRISRPRVSIEVFKDFPLAWMFEAANLQWATIQLTSWFEPG
jgi:hypothetical protein